MRLLQLALTDVRYWYLTDNSTAAAFVRYWTKADIGQPRADLCLNPDTLCYLIDEIKGL